MSNIDKQALTDEAISKAFAGTNFGRDDFKNILAETVIDAAAGWRCGFTATTICTQLGLLTPKGCASALGLRFISEHVQRETKRLKDELEAAEKRITELERNEIREEGNQFLVVRHPGKLPVVKHCAGELEGFLRQLLEHDPMATIDIVTHRYYGVGGQWVQDADEYLQMMAAAAGKGE
ncbi:ead/Ea22-like family protein [Enterobacter hormaechei]|uniref:ead/Ea22-like family protein n=1 Tax=Enterobacter hormaechei TaxID=158836 RepID=UPI00299F8C92|nr:ead/Ea22-like family protein [Enterobacter hormaechei]